MHQAIPDYNVVDITWYDTGIGRDGSYFDNVSGNMYTSGKTRFLAQLHQIKISAMSGNMKSETIRLIWFITVKEGSDLAPS